MDSLVQDHHPLALVYRRNSVTITIPQQVAQFFQSGHQNRTADEPVSRVFLAPAMALRLLFEWERT